MTMMQGAVLEGAAAMPASTWNFLKANDSTIRIPAGLAATSHVQARIACEARGGADALDDALERAQQAWEADHPAPTEQELAEQRAFLEAEADATYGGTAQSAYQRAADALEQTRSLRAGFDHGLGAQAAQMLRAAAGEPLVVAAAPGAHVEAQVLVEACAGDVSAAAIDVVAAQGSRVALSVIVDGGDAPETASDEPAGVTGTTLRVVAAEDADVSVVRTQTLGGAFMDMDDTALLAGPRARVSVRHTVLGAAESFTGLACDLRGDDASLALDTRYLGRDDRKLDFNYAVRHHGMRTTCDLKANGVLTGRSRKTLRGTIDLVRGCRGSEGSEHETVLLVDEGVQNTTVPVILCNEDDVAGNHGATIGHIRPEQLFYLASRGLAPQQAERLFAGAVLEQAVLDAPDDETREAVIRLGEGAEAGFGALFDER